MGKLAYLFFFCWLIICKSFSQGCLPSGIILNSQLDVDSFPLLYPNCHSIEGTLTIEGTDIKNLEALAVLTGVQGDFSIQNTTLLTSLHGLQNLTDLGGSIYIQENQSLTDLSAFSNIDTINGDLRIKSNQQLRDLIGFESVIKIKDSLQISHNPQLLSLNFEQLKSVVSQLSIINNDRLKHLYGFEGITFQLGGIKIILNDSLVDYHGFDNLAILRSELYISDNPLAVNFSGFENLREVGGLILANLPCRDLTGFSAVQRVRGNMEIGLSEKMESLQGAPLLQKIDYIFTIYKINRLKDLQGLNQLEEVWDLRIEKNDSLVSLQGLNGLKTIGANIQIKDNKQLQDLTALLGATGLEHHITISKNEILQSLDGLDNLCISPIEEFIIKDNPNLSICNNPCLCAHLLQGGQNTINENSPGCNSRDEVTASCLVKLDDPKSGQVIQVSPNPTFQFLEIKGLTHPSFHYSILDIFGEEIMRGKSDQPLLDIEPLPSGLYLLLIREEGNIYSHRIVKF